MVKINLALRLFLDRKFDEAVGAYERQLLEDSEENKWANLAGLAEALLASGKYAEAIPIFEKVSDYQSNSHPGALGRQEQLSVCHWMTGDRDSALGIIRDVVIAVRGGRIGYTDISGGVPYGLIFCYMAITLHSISDVDLAMNYLKKLATRPRIQYWPGPAAQFLLGGLTFGTALKSATGSTDLAEGTKLAEQDGWKRRYLTSLLFSADTERRMADDEKEPECSLPNARASPIRWSNTNGILQEVKFLRSHKGERKVERRTENEGRARSNSRISYCTAGKSATGPETPAVTTHLFYSINNVAGCSSIPLSFWMNSAAS